MNIRPATLAVMATATILTGAALSACDDQPIDYTPAAYGEVIGGVGHCYYTDNIGEAYLLRSTGACPASWIPWPMPVYWHDRYWSYYSSSAWIDRYVPITQRATYRTTYITNYYNVNKSGIATYSKSAIWKGSNGKTVTGTSSKVTFGGGSGRTYSGSGGTTVKRDSSSSYRSSTTSRSSSGTSFGGGSGRRKP